MLQGSEKKPLEKEPLTRVVKNLLKMKCTDDYYILTPNLLEEHLKKELASNEFDQLKQFIETGKDLSLPQNLDGNFKLTKQKVLYPKYNFDLEAFFHSHKINDLQSDSPEYKAGLRDGMEVLQYNFYLHEPRRKVTISVKSNGEVKSIQFFPQTQYASILQYAD
jgi:predicted metalloprotease with PDZ domain